jgi:recombination protein RecT
MADKQLTTQEKRFKTVGAWLQSPNVLAQLNAAAPMGVVAQRMSRICLTTIRQSDKLLECDVESLVGAVMICAQTGLEPGPIGHAAIVPYKRRATWQAMFKGLLHLAYRSEMIQGVQCEVVYEGDEFDFEEGSKAFVHHKRALDQERLKRPRIAAYCSMETSSGLSIVRVMPAHEIEAVRQRYSKDTRDSAAWAMEWDEMACKTVIKRTAKRAPVSVEAKVAIGYDDLADTGAPQPTDVNVSGDPPEEPEGGYCNKNVGNEGLVCGLATGHSGACEA